MEDPREAGRLAAKVDPHLWVDTYLSGRVPDQGRVMDVGCGPGTIAEAVQDSVPTASVVGLDSSIGRFRSRRICSEKQVGFIQADVRAIPLQDATQDLVYSRFLLQYLKDPEQAVREMVRVCRPGGLVLLQDLDGQLVWHDPPDPALEELIGRTIAGLEETGFNPFVGRRLRNLLFNSGVKEIEVRVDVYHLIAGQVSHSGRVQWELKLSNALPEITRIIGETDACRLVDRFLTYLAREDTTTYSVLFTVTGRRSDA
jgi:ubiquinone/menaquinone biosynthesis C-methylase UbiE